MIDHGGVAYPNMYCTLRNKYILNIVYKRSETFSKRVPGDSLASRVQPPTLVARETLLSLLRRHGIVISCLAFRNFSHFSVGPQSLKS